MALQHRLSSLLFIFSICPFILFTPSTATAAALPGAAHAAQPPQLPLPVTSITRSNVNTFENLAVRANGQILTTTTAPLAQIFQVDPCTPSIDKEPILVATIPNIQSALGIHELAPDVFYLAAANISMDANSLHPETLTIWKLDMRHFRLSSHHDNDETPMITHPATLEKVATLPSTARAPNGVTAPPHQEDFILVADSLSGCIFRVDVHSGDTTIVFDDKTLRGTGTGVAAFGVNGIGVYENVGSDHGTWLYYTNSGAGTLHKIRICKETGYVGQGSIPVLVTDKLMPDDLVVDERDGAAYVASAENLVWRVRADGSKNVLAGGGSERSLVSPTSVRFGRGKGHKGSLYITTGRPAGPPEDAGTAGVSRVDIARL